jgi:hypothetical protein
MTGAENGHHQEGATGADLGAHAEPDIRRNGGALVAGSGGGGRGAQVVPLRTGGVIAGIVPQTIEEVFRLATAIAKSGMAPRDMGSPEKLTVAILHGLEIGIPPMMAINKIAVVNGRPTLWGDAVPALLLSKGFRIREEMETGPSGRTAICSVIRPNGERIERTFSEADAKTAGLWGKQGPWKQYPDRMLQMRARGLAARDGAADVLSGIYLAEEAQDISEPVQSSDLMPTLPAQDQQRMSSAKAKREGVDIAMNELRGAISGADTLEQLEDIRNANAEFWTHAPYSWVQIVQAEFDDRVLEFQAEQS